MSANSDTRQLIDAALAAGLSIEKAKHKGYKIMDADGAVVGHIRTGGRMPSFAVQRARRAIEKASRSGEA